MIFIFDLDNTLYLKKDGAVYNPKLVMYLKKLKCKKYIFSNNTEEIGMNILQKLKIKSQFSKKLFLGKSHIKKPSIQSYIYAQHFFNLKSTDNIIFFDDRKENRLNARKIGWKSFKLNIS